MLGSQVVAGARRLLVGMSSKAGVAASYRHADTYERRTMEACVTAVEAKESGDVIEQLRQDGAELVLAYARVVELRRSCSDGAWEPPSLADGVRALRAVEPIPSASFRTQDLALCGRIAGGGRRTSAARWDELQGWGRCIVPQRRHV